MPYLLKNTSQIVAALEFTARSIKEFVNHEFREKNYDISYEQWEVIHSINKNEGLSQIELAKSCGKGPASISRTISHLSKKIIVKKKRGKINKRINRIFLTDEGKLLCEKTNSVVEAVSKQCLENIFDRELNLFTKMLIRIQKNHGNSEL